MDIQAPTPEQIREVVATGGITRAEAAALVHVSVDSWHSWCAPVGTVKHRQMPLTAWELLLLKLGRHPKYAPLTYRDK